MNSIQTLRVVVWNCRRTTEQSPLWAYLGRLNPTIALLQDVTSVPNDILAGYQVLENHPLNEIGKPQRFKSVILAKGTIEPDLSLSASEGWVNKELKLFSGNLLTAKVTLADGRIINVVDVYSPAWPLDAVRLNGINTDGVQLTQNRKLWVTDLLWSALRHTLPKRKDSWVIGGDFNASETFDAWPGGPRGNREYLDRMNELNLIECLRKHQGKLTPTFRNARGGAVVHQIDHLFVTRDLASQLQLCEVGLHDDVFGENMSDHLPIIADFNK